jgi:hypothetical protein
LTSCSATTAAVPPRAAGALAMCVAADRVLSSHGPARGTLTAADDPVLTLAEGGSAGPCSLTGLSVACRVGVPEAREQLVPNVRSARAPMVPPIAQPACELGRGIPWIP